MKRAALGLALLLIWASTADTYVSNFTNGQRDHWVQPPTWQLNLAASPNIQGSRSRENVISASFATWMAAPNTTVSAIKGADTSVGAPGNDHVNLICFTCRGADFGNEGDTETLAITLTTVQTSPGPGQIIDSDILFNPDRQFTTDGTPGMVDLESVAIHEIGHFFGLDHTAIARAVMFPFSPENERRLAYDDAAGITAHYPAAMRRIPTFTISGSVRLNGAAVFGAHVFAESQTVALTMDGFNLRKSPISTLSLPDGTYRIEGVPNDSYIIIAEPLDLPVEDDNLTGYASSFGRSAVQTNFITRWH